MIKDINKLKMSQKITHLSVDVDLMVVNVTRDKNGTMIGVSVSAKKTRGRITCEKDYAWNLVYVLASVTRIVNT